MAGEEAGSGAAHADNAAPALYGGIVLTLADGGLHAVELPVPDGLWAVVVHPHLEVETQDARRVLGDTVPLAAAVTQWGNTAGLVAGLYREDWGLIARTLVDVVAEPWRASRVPGFPEVKAAALAAGALGCSLSGSGPSVFALCRGEQVARAVGGEMGRVFGDVAAIDSDLYVSPVNRRGPRVEAIGPPGGDVVRGGAAHDPEAAGPGPSSPGAPTSSRS